MADALWSRAELKDKLAQETDAGRQLTLRKELEGKTYQDRLDKLVRPFLPTFVARSNEAFLLDDRLSDDSRGPRCRSNVAGALGDARGRPRHPGHREGGEARHLRRTRIEEWGWGGDEDARGGA